ncbi:MAG: helix-turn-helix domain-containing protein [Patescibacteria group bacterium]
MSFVKRLLGDQPLPLAKQLRLLRKGRTLALESIANQTKIQLKYLQALESGDYSNLPEPLYTRNYLVSYVQALNGDVAHFLTLYNAEVGQVDLIAPHRLPRERVRMRLLALRGGWWRLLFGGVALFLVLGYLGWLIWQVEKRPLITIEWPADQQVLASGVVEILGFTDTAEVEIKLNGEVLTVDENGRFKGELYLRRGPNEVIVTGKRRYSKQGEARLILIYAEEFKGSAVQ